MEKLLILTGRASNSEADTCRLLITGLAHSSISFLGRNCAVERLIYRVAARRPASPRGDLEALTRSIVALSQLATYSTVADIDAEVNPLIIHRAGDGVVVVVDALMALA